MSLLSFPHTSFPSSPPFFLSLIIYFSFLSSYVYFPNKYFICFTQTNTLLFISVLLVSPNYSPLEAFQKWWTLNYHLKEMYRNVCVCPCACVCMRACAHMHAHVCMLLLLVIPEV